MPRLKMSEKQQRDQEVKALILKNATYLGMKGNKEIAERIGVSESTLVRKLKHPDSFTLREINRLAKVLKFKITIQDKLPCEAVLAGE